MREQERNVHSKILRPPARANDAIQQFSFWLDRGFPKGAKSDSSCFVKRLERYIEVVGERCGALPDRRSGGNVRYTMSDIGLAAFSVFFMQSPSFLAHQRALAHGRGRSNAETLLGMTTIPSDNHIRQMLDGVPTDHFDGAFATIVKELHESGGLGPMRRLGGRTLIALDGSEHFCSRKIHCPSC